MAAFLRYALALLAAGVAFCLAPVAAATGAGPIVPNCRHDPDPLSIAAKYAAAVCGNVALREQAKQVKARGDALARRLPAAWRKAFAAHQAALPGAVYNCPPDDARKAADCLGEIMRQRLIDIDDLAASLSGELPDCRPSDVAVRETDFGDAGMAQGTSVYVLDYKGSSSCRIRGYPRITVYDGDGKRQFSYAVYTGVDMYVGFDGPPLPVTLSPRSPGAWFALSSSSGCDTPAGGRPGYKVDVALPLSAEVLKTFALQSTTCRRVSVTPIGAMSMMKAAIH